MKKLFVFAAAAIFAAALAVSCQEKEIEVNVSPNVQMVTMTCELPSSDSKVAVSNEGKVAWEVGDQIHIHTGHIRNGEYTTVTLTADDISADGKSAKISFEALKPYDYSGWGGTYSTYYAAYPADALKNPESCYEKQYFGNSNAVLMAASDKDGVFKFHNLCGLISFSVSGDFDSYVFVGNNDEIVGYDSYAVAIVEPNESYDYLNKYTSGPQTSISGKLVNGANIIGLPNGADFSGGFAIKLKKDGEIVKEAKTEKAINVERGKMLVLGDITDKLGAPSAHKNKITDAVNLAATETANCYIIDKAGAYKIPAVKGNSNESVGTVCGVKLVWETYNSNEENVVLNSVIAAVDYEDDAVFFKTPDNLKPGNALIAALDKDDNIVWSWHIWIPATPINEIGSYNVSDKYLMDRNLGALKATEAGESIIDITSIGLFYQWGRKDPFVGPGTIDEGKYLGSANVAGSARTADKVQISLEESIKQPTFFARGHYTGDTQDNPDWCSDQNADYWGDSGDKSIYDPCPAGYRVPKKNSKKLLWADSVEGYEYSATCYWFKIGDPAVVFPAAGWIDGGTAKSTCRFGLWNTHNDSYENPSTGSSNYAAYARRFYIESGAVKLKNSSVNKSLGYGVRCESISNTVPEPAVEPDPGQGDINITIDGDMSDWDNVVGGTSGDHTFKIAADETNVYFYNFRAVGSRYSEIWSNSAESTSGGYIYVGFDLDGDETNGESLNGNGPYDFVFFVTPYTGGSESPAIAESFLTLGYGADCRPETATVENIVGKGVITEAGVAVEYSIPRADMPKIPETAVKVKSWGNKSLSSVTLNKAL